MDFTRRNFLVYAGIGTYGMLRSLSLEAALFPLPRKKTNGPIGFRPIAASSDDALKLPKGFRQSTVASFGDALGSTGPLGAEKFGSDNDFLAYFPIDALKGGKNSNEGLLWVNHEAFNPIFVSDYSGTGKKTREQIRAEKLSVGGSVLHVKKESNGWTRRKDSNFTRRLTAAYPQIKLTGPAASVVGEAVGTLANCSGGRTPWSTALSCEENYQNFNRTEGDTAYGWSQYPEDKLDERQYGWVVEIDPFNELPPQKHTALGRFSHENAALTQGKTGKLVVYMGDDDKDQYFYKFVSDQKWDARLPRAEQRRCLESGTLYAADFEKGKWIPLDLERNEKLKEAGFKSQADVLIDTRKAATAVKATPLDRPEDCEVSPVDGSVYLALTNNSKHGNYAGQIVRLVEDKDDAEGTSFRYEIFLVGGAQTGLACPDNLVFDKKGNLWVSCDISSSSIGKNAYQAYGNNGLFMVPTRGASLGNAYQFASAPNEAELTGPWFTEDGSTLFISVQHPGETSTSRSALTSHWPDGGNALPRSSVVAIGGF